MDIYLGLQNAHNQLWENDGTGAFTLKSEAGLSSTLCRRSQTLDLAS